MSRADRLLRLLQVMRQMSPPITASRLAEATETSIRSLYRDIDSLRAAGARIEGERGYGYRLIEDYALPPQTFTREELEVIALGMAEVRSMGHAPMASAAEVVLAKIAAIVPDGHEQQLIHAISRVYRPDRHMQASPYFEIVQSASWSEHALEITYLDKGGAMSARTIFPLAVVYTEQVQTILAWCCLRDDFRMFRLDRLQRVSKSSQSFRPRRAALLRRYIEQLDARPSPPQPKAGTD